MEKQNYEQGIKELQTLRDSIDQRIQVLSERSGMDVFENRIKELVVELEKFINDRCENEDTHMLWKIAIDVQNLLTKCLNTLSGLQEG